MTDEQFKALMSMLEDLKFELTFTRLNAIRTESHMEDCADALCLIRKKIVKKRRSASQEAED